MRAGEIKCVIGITHLIDKMVSNQQFIAPLFHVLSYGE